MNGHLCVFRVMSHFLVEECGIEASVVYDQPPSHAGRIDVDDMGDVAQPVHMLTRIYCKASR
jgi:hypothetical protein